MDIRKMALALPLAFGIACSTSQSSRTARTEEPAPPAGTGATREGSPGAAGSDAEGGRVATTPGRTGTTTTPDDGTLSGDRTMGGTSDLKGHASDRVLMGKVESVSGRSLSIQSDMGDSRTLEIVPETIITVDGREGSSADIREGQPIRASFNEQDGKQVAVKIEAGEMMGGTGHMGDTHMGGHGDMGTTGTGSGAGTTPESGTTGTSPADTGTSTSGSGTDSGYDTGTRR
ncbi:hypothetical protein [Anaeromyxobacter sp. Fw109-5]|uniref:hypothetical protein n=1 Tax=Anaeromyxobacter sp. (strain Fw109-5) TaxID=404589 RepID=UPI0000ED6E5D|nr:hypothetical protein [Anaeromyxobacter sp. Fw109-5]ABS28085.1 conserved hypothetical protein [Anaeromyxobacter sp. Fw109-5]